MFQDFSYRRKPSVGQANLPKLRSAMAGLGTDAFYIPHDEEYQNEYLPDANERLAWSIGFTGSADNASIFAGRAVSLVDGRSNAQAHNQTDRKLIEINDLSLFGPFDWLATQNLKNIKIGYDPSLSRPTDVSKLASTATQMGIQAIEIESNPIDIAWTDRSDLPVEKVCPHPEKFMGESTVSKIRRFADVLSSRGVGASVFTAHASNAWLFNLRGRDVRHSPLPSGHAILYVNGTAELFLDDAKIDDALKQHLGSDVQLYSPNRLLERLGSLSNKFVNLDPNFTSAWFFNKLSDFGVNIIPASDPVIPLQAQKNATDIKGIATAHERDSIARIRFLRWLSEEGQSGEVTEIDVAKKLETLRKERPELKDLSFETTSGTEPNSALPHYRVSTQSNRKLDRGMLCLVYSDGQFLDGTTDVTQIIPIGTPSSNMRRHYTLVLKAHIALATARFSIGTTGTHLDTIARLSLWKTGLDFELGTGHSVGVYLGVHEGPQKIAKGWHSNPLLPGMIVSNDPRHYKVGSYGMRIENHLFVLEAPDIEGGETPMLGFQNLTWLPLSRDLIELSLLTAEEQDWVNDYHAETLKRLNNRLSKTDATWLGKICMTLEV